MSRPQKRGRNFQKIGKLCFRKRTAAPVENIDPRCAKWRRARRGDFEKAAKQRCETVPNRWKRLGAENARLTAHTAAAARRYRAGRCSPRRGTTDTCWRTDASRTERTELGCPNRTRPALSRPMNGVRIYHRHDPHLSALPWGSPTPGRMEAVLREAAVSPLLAARLGTNQKTAGPAPRLLLSPL